MKVTSKTLRNSIVIALVLSFATIFLAGCGKSELDKQIIKAKTQQSQKANMMIKVTKERMNQMQPGTEAFFDAKEGYYRALWEKARMEGNQSDMDKYGLEMMNTQKQGNELINKQYE
jgi:hypothetical protein